MSKIYDKYLELKAQDSSKMYLFKSGNFYIFIADDCEKINNYLVLKKVKFTNDIMKCGFPLSAIDDYKRVFANQKLNVEIIDDIELKEISNITAYLKDLNVDKLTPIEALNIIYRLKELACDK